MYTSLCARIVLSRIVWLLIVPAPPPLCPLSSIPAHTVCLPLFAPSFILPAPTVCPLLYFSFAQHLHCIARTVCSPSHAAHCADCPNCTACMRQYSSQDVGRKDVLPVGSSDIRLLMLYEPPGGPPNRRQGPRNRNEWSVEFVMVHTASSLVVIVLVVGLLVTVCCCVCCSWGHADWITRRSLPYEYWVKHAHRLRLAHPRWDNPWIQVGLVVGLALVVLGLVWYFVLGALRHSEATDFHAEYIGLGISGAGLLLFGAVALRALCEDREYRCPVCDKPASPWRFLGVSLPQRFQGDVPSKAHAHCVRCVRYTEGHACIPQMHSHRHACLLSTDTTMAPSCHDHNHPQACTLSTSTCITHAYLLSTTKSIRVCPRSTTTTTRMPPIHNHNHTCMPPQGRLVPKAPIYTHQDSHRFHAPQRCPFPPGDTTCGAPPQATPYHSHDCETTFWSGLPGPLQHVKCSASGWVPPWLSPLPQWRLGQGLRFRPPFPPTGG